MTPAVPDPPTFAAGGHDSPRAVAARGAGTLRAMLAIGSGQAVASPPASTADGAFGPRPLGSCAYVSAAKGAPGKLPTGRLAGKAVSELFVTSHELVPKAEGPGKPTSKPILNLFPEAAGAPLKDEGETGTPYNDSFEGGESPDEFEPDDDMQHTSALGWAGDEQ